MEGKIQHFQIKGMQRDLSRSKFSPEYSFENKNIRIVSRGKGTLMSVTNERGQKKITFGSPTSNFYEINIYGNVYEVLPEIIPSGSIRVYGMAYEIVPDEVDNSTYSVVITGTVTEPTN